VTIRRILLAALTAALVAGPLGTTAAHASFGDSAAVTSMTLGTATIDAPGNVIGKLTCGASTSTMSATWTASGARSVSGYLVTVYFSDGFKQTVQLGPTATSWSSSISTYNVTAYSVQYSVTTQTSYGWTAESDRTARFSC
jgi:hypothetical protein